LDHTERALALFSAVAPAQRPDGLTEMDLTRGASVLAGAAGQQERSLTFARSAVAMIDSDTDPEEAATSLRRLVIALAVFDGTADERGELIARAWQLVAELPASGRRAWVLAVRASTVRRTDPEQAAESARMAIADAATAGAAAAMSDALVTLGLVEDRAGHVEQAEGHLRAAIAPARQAGAVNTELRAHFFLGLHELDLGRLPAALRALQQGNRRARETGLRWCVYGLELRTVSMVAHFVAGEWDEVAELMADRPPRSDTVTARVSATGLGVLVGRGRFTECEALLRQLREHWHLDGTIAVSAGTEGAVSALWQGDAARAEARIAELLEFVDAEDDQVHLSTIRIAAIGLIAAAEVSATDAQDRGVVQRRADALMARVRHTVEKASPAGATLGPEARAWIAVATAAHQQCHGGDAVAGWAAAVDAFDYGDDYQQACARLRLAGLLLTGGMPERARDQLVAALQVAERVGAEPLREAITALAGRARLSLPGKEQAGKQRRRSTGDEVFTPRELAVLRLVAGGQTNRAVGEALFISEKTVSVHLSRVMAKLGARRRAEAVAIAIQRRLLDP
ncbi:MAG: LuxR C-terminal-related transcriptional regulator, partial [Sciscionella sp.]